MKKYLLSLLSIAMAAFISFNLVACGDDDEDALGSIYGIVTELGTAEPMKAIGVELYKGGSLLLKTVTFDDGHFEFNDLLPGNYKVNVVADGYNEEEGDVIVEAGRQARIDLQIRKMKTHMVVRTTEATINGTKVTLTGDYTYENGYAPSEVGILYATYNNPKNGGILVKCKLDNNTKKLSTTIDELEKGTYYYQAYAKNSVGTAYGDVRSFKMSNAPIVTTLPPTNVLATTATLNGRIDAEGDPAYTERGFVYSKSYGIPTVDDPANATTKVTVSGRNKTFSANVSSLTEDATYYVRAYATSEDGTFYGAVKAFVPSAPLPSVSTLEATNILDTSATLNGRIDNPGEPAYTERGFLYSGTHETPTISDPSTSTTKITVAGTSRDYNTSISSLEIGTTYYVRAYATSSKGTSYGEVKSFSTTDSREYVVIEGIAVQKQDLGKGNWNTVNNMCKASRVGGFSDWRLPTISELAILYTHRNEIGGFTTSYYWSSSPYGTETSSHTLDGYMSHWQVYFSNGTNYREDYDDQAYVRAVRTIK